jgi:hypothetical protein
MPPIPRKRTALITLADSLDLAGAATIASVAFLTTLASFPNFAGFSSSVAVAVIASGAIASVAIVVCVAASVAALAGADDWGRGPGRPGPWAMRCVTTLLPGQSRARYREEWAAELYDARADGEPWYQRAATCARILAISIPRLAVTLRLDGRRVRG